MADEAAHMDADAEAEPAVSGGGIGSKLGWILVLVLLVAIGLGVVRTLFSHEQAASIAAKIAAGDRPPAPKLPVEGLDGHAVANVPSLNGSPAGHVLVVNYFASWCGPCHDEAAGLVKLAHQYASKGVEFIGVDAQDATSDAQKFVDEYRIDYPVVYATRPEEQAWGVTGFPETFVIGTDGRVSAHESGPIDSVSLKAAVDSELRARRA